MGHRQLLRGPIFLATVLGGSQLKSGKGAAAIMDIGVMAQILSSLATFVVAAGILYQGREAPVRDYY
jgi:hypothetical protein